MMLGADTSNNMSGGVYILGWALLAMGVRLWPVLLWGPLGILCAFFTFVGGVWTYDTLNRGNATLRMKLALMLGIPIAMNVLVWLLPLNPMQS